MFCCLNGKYLPLPGISSGVTSPLLSTAVGVTPSHLTLLSTCATYYSSKHILLQLNNPTFTSLIPRFPLPSLLTLPLLETDGPNTYPLKDVQSVQILPFPIIYLQSLTSVYHSPFKE